MEKIDEQKNLDYIIDVTKNIINEEKEDITLLKNNNNFDKDKKLELIENKLLKIDILNNSLDNPYFAKLNVTIDNDTNDILIGKNAISRDDDIYVTDWRAPISSLYYDSEIGDTTFYTIDKKIDCKLNLKRQYEIIKGKIINYFDVDLVSNDELLNKYLNKNNDVRLKNIISTIQKEQNEVIRKKLSHNMIVQGIAGSGKTTVALHRIAYLVYNYRNIIKDDMYLVIGPNEVFIKYINSVLPDLSVNRVNQFTFTNFVSDYLNEKINIREDVDKSIELISEKDQNISNFKSSLKYKDMLDLFIKDYIDNIFIHDIKIDNIIVISRNYMYKEFIELYNKLNTSLNVVIDLLITRLVNYVSLKHDNLLNVYTNQKMELYDREENDNNKKRIKEELLNMRTEINKNCKTLIKNYFKNVSYDAIKVYKLFISDIDKYNVFNYQYINDLKNSKNITYDDLCALLYIKYHLKINDKYSSIRHTVIDEAQDYNLFHFYVLKCVLSSSTFSIFGDLAQGIYSYRSIDSWDSINSIFQNNINLIEFNKSYRTTKQIMDVANKVISYTNYNKSTNVIRNGEVVKFHKEDDNVNYIIKRIDELKNKGYKTIGIISKNSKLSLELNDKLIKYNKNIVNINSNVNINECDICTISAYLAKGLEFDAVIIDNCNEDVYDVNNLLDLKLLYIAITRALQSVDIIYSSKLSRALL